MKYLFILGCERSGSTWLGNIFDSHPEAITYTEPFADYLDLFRGFPTRFTPVDFADSVLEKKFETVVKALREMKYCLSYKPGKSSRFQQLDNTIFKIYWRCCAVLKVRPSLKMERYQALNFAADDLPFFFFKYPSAEQHVIKELRLNFKVPLLARTFPEAKVLIAIRNPATQLMSIKKLLKLGNLSELQSHLVWLKSLIVGNEKFRRYWPLMEGDAYDQDENYRWVVWWFINYDCLIRDCKKHTVDYRIIPNEALSTEPEANIRSIFEWAGMPFAESTSKYLQHSSKGDSNRPFSPRNTTRNSLEHLKLTQNQVEESIKVAVKRVFSTVRPCEEILTNYETP